MAFMKYSDAEWAAYDRRPSAYAEASMEEWMSHQHGRREARGAGRSSSASICPHCYLRHHNHARCGRLGK